MKKRFVLLTVACLCIALTVQAQRRQMPREAFTTDTPMVHDPVMAYEDSTYYLYATGLGIQQMTSKDRKTWTVLPQPVMTVIPGWTTDSVPVEVVWAQMEAVLTDIGADAIKIGMLFSILSPSSLLPPQASA